MHSGGTSNASPGIGTNADANLNALMLEGGLSIDNQPSISFPDAFSIYLMIFLLCIRTILHGVPCSGALLTCKTNAYGHWHTWFHAAIS